MRSSCLAARGSRRKTSAADAPAVGRRGQHGASSVSSQQNEKSLKDRLLWPVVATVIAGTILLFLEHGTDLFSGPEAGSEPAGTVLPDTHETCIWLQGNFPQSPQDVKAKFGMSSNRNIRLIYEICRNAANGFILEEGERILLEVPEGGCIDSDDRAVFSDQTTQESFGGRRAYSGSVLVTAATYRVRGCVEKPR